MAYNPVAQLEHELHSNGSNGSGSPPPPNDFSFRPISMEFDNLGGSSFMSSVKPADNGGSNRLGSMLRSFASTGTSYDMVENDEYDTMEGFGRRAEAHDTETEIVESPKEDKSRFQHSSSPEPIVRTTSMGPPVPLRHPTPDLQSLQGAYVGNVERLEQSAERLSMSSDIGGEIRRLELGQRRPERQWSAPGSGIDTMQRPRQFSTSSSIIGVNNTARGGGYSPGGYIPSPKGSFRSGSWTQQLNLSRTGSKASRLASLPEPQQEGRPLDSPLVSNNSSIPPPNSSAYTQPYNYHADEEPPSVPEPALHSGAAPGVMERPSTAASQDTYRQATTLFTDFDGVHYSPHGNLSRQVSLNRPPLASGSEHYEEPTPGQSMVYYPAPVPMILNLPQRLSKMPSAAERERRRTKVLSSVPLDARKSAAWLSEVPEVDESERTRNKRDTNHSSINLLSVPPQLRASAFFDQPTERQEVQVKQSSAVATLDSILDASAHAPVSAFTDHPIVGHVGAEVYGKTSRKSIQSDERRKSKSSTMLRSRVNSGVPPTIRSRHSEAAFDPPDMDAVGEGGERGSARSSRDIIDRADLMLRPDDEGEEQSEDEDQEEEERYIGPPTTLLAELQLRKQQQKQRNRTAATAFPNGMHSTLLELDAVAQVQQQSRQHKQITLAWEDPEISATQDDDDIPLGMLFPGKKTRDENRPLGLMEKREMEDNEPLSRRRARLRGEAPPPGEPSPGKCASTVHAPKVPGLTDDDAEEEGETLAQRIRRLKAQGSTATELEDDFASEILAQFGSGQRPEATSKTPDAEETLAQRRRRLQAQAGSREVSGSTGDVPNLKGRHSLANILQTHPAAGARKASNEKFSTMQTQPMHHSPAYPRNLQQPNYSGMVYGGLPRYPSYGSTPYTNGIGYNQMMYPQMGINGFGQTGGFGESMMDQGEMGLDPKQRDMIDRWRQSVMY